VGVCVERTTAEPSHTVPSNFRIHQISNTRCSCTWDSLPVSPGSREHPHPQTRIVTLCTCIEHHSRICRNGNTAVTSTASPRIRSVKNHKTSHSRLPHERNNQQHMGTEEHGARHFCRGGETSRARERQVRKSSCALLFCGAGAAEI
jgi:hypothetical protein